MKSSVNVKSVLSSPDYKVISVSGDAGDALEKHKVSEGSILLVKKGAVTYSENDKNIVLSEGEGHAIPPEVYHEVRCNETAEVFVIIPKKGKLKFER